MVKRTVLLKIEKDSDDVFIVGSFNDWKPSSLEYDEEQHVYKIELDLGAGEHLFRFSSKSQALIFSNLYPMKGESNCIVVEEGKVVQFQ